MTGAELHRQLAVVDRELQSRTLNLRERERLTRFACELKIELLFRWFWGRS